MKILITTDHYTVKTNGVVTSLQNLCDELIALGHDVRILTLSESMRSHVDGYVYYIRSMPLAVYPGIRMTLCRRHRYIDELVKWSPDVIHSQCEFFSFKYAMIISKRSDAPVVHTYHTLYEQYTHYIIPGKRLGHFVARTFSRMRLRGVRCVIAPTRKVEDALRAYGISNKIVVVPSGICMDQHKERITPEERESMRERLGISRDMTVLLNLGRLGAEKNLDEMMHLFAKALSTHDDLMFLIVGDGPDRGKLERLAEKLGISDRVVFTGMVSPTEVQKYYQLGDVFVSASTSETQGLTYIEAAANGLPLLCREDPCLRDVIVQGKNGYEYGTAEEFLRDLDAIESDADWRMRASVSSESIAENFDKSNFGIAVERVYEEAVEAHA